ncbi:MAG: glycosyltransferase [Thermoguttaceae bacterium]|nr:glycosyltransferase [Thermoguttaceae bacterium]
MKLLLFMGNGCFIDSFGGAEKVACEMANAFTRRGWSVTIVCNDLKPGRPAYPIRPEVNLINLNGTGKKLGSIPKRIKIGRELTRPLRGLGVSYFFDRVKEIEIAAFNGRLDRAIAETAPDVILPFFIADLLAVTKCRSAERIPIVQMLHDTPEKAIGPPSTVIRNALDKTSCVQVLLESFLPGVRKCCDAETAVIPNAVPQYSGQVRYREEDARRIVNIARLEPKQKQQHLLIDAFALLADAFPNWTLHCYGADQDGKYRLELEQQIIGLGLQKRVFLEGVTNRVEETLLSADIFAFPSAWEGFGIALLEAMRVGLPVVGFRSAPAVGELVKDGENGLLADDGAAGFAAALRRLIQDASLRRRLGENARVFAERYAPENIWDQWEELLTRVIRKGASEGERRTPAES